MPQKAPGQSHREGITLMEFFAIFPDDRAAEEWFVQQRWPSGVGCPKCGSVNVQERATRKPQPYRCRDCRKDFSAKTGTIMQGSPLSFRTWALALYILTTNIKGTSSDEAAPGFGRHAERLRGISPTASGRLGTTARFRPSMALWRLTRPTSAARR